jgi:hypothetical protein
MIERLPEKSLMQSLNAFSTPFYSSELSPCDFLLFGILKHEMRDRLLQTAEEIGTTVKTIFDGLTLEEVQSVFFNLMELLE